jgi:1-acyl-sn-glycerol-3-phosphate acyltransferase
MRLWYDIDSLDNRDPRFIDWLHRWWSRPLLRYFRAEVRGLERVPSGPALFVGNHSSGAVTPDLLILGAALYGAHGLAGLPFGLGHEVTIRLPGIHHVIVPCGAVRASHELAHRLFARGHKVLVYPGGDVEAMRPYRDRDRIIFDGRRGYVRLALRARVPIIPAVSAGSHATFIVLHDGRFLASWLRLDRLLRLRVFPLTLSFPWGLTLGPLLSYLPYPTRILTEILDPIRLEPDGPDAARDEDHVARCAAHVEATMQAALERLSGERSRRRGGWRSPGSVARRPGSSWPASP